MNSKIEPPIKIFILEPNRMLRDTFAKMLRKRAGMTVVGDSPDSPGAIEHLVATDCDVLLASSLKALREIGLGNEAVGCLLNIKAVLFGMEDDQETFLQAVRLGACGYLLKDASSTEIITAVQGIARGEVSCTPKLCRFMFEYIAKEAAHRAEKPEEQTSPVNGLTCRQRQLMALVAQGMTNKEIAKNLHLSEFTIKNHIHRVMKSLGVDSRYTAVDEIRTRGLFLSG